MEAGAGKAQIRLDGLLSGRYVKIQDQLWVRTVILWSDHPAALVSLELPSLVEGTEALQMLVSRRAGIPVACVWITVSHTFSAPHITGCKSSGPKGHPERRRTPEEERIQTLQTQALCAALEQAVSDALNSRQKAYISYGFGQSYVSAGRDIYTSGGWWVGEGSRAFSDKDLIALKIAGEDPSPIAVIYSFPVQSSILQDTIMPEGGCYISGDLCGFASRSYENEHPGSVALFLCGCAGDQMPRQKGHVQIVGPDGQMEETDRGIKALSILDELGSELAGDLAQALRYLRAELLSPDIQTERYPVRLPGKVPEKGRIDAPVRQMTYTLHGEIETDLFLIRLGPIILVGVKPELSAGIGAEIRRRSPFACTLVATMVNGSEKYLADRWGFDHYTYAARNGCFAPGAAEQLCDFILEHLEEMYEQSESGQCAST